MMATNITEINVETSGRLNINDYYTSTKVNFMEDLQQYLNKGSRNPSLWSRDRVKEKIMEIKETKGEPKFTANASKFDIALLNGEEILIVSDTTRQVLPYEDYFDVFIDLHYRFDHLKASEMYKRLISEYVIDDKVLSIFMSSCSACPNTSIYLNSFNKLVHVDILGMAQNPDNGFRYILIFIDIATNFILLRPLLNIDTNEVASELYKIFIDIGPPNVISATNTEVLMDAMEVLKHTPIKYDIPIYEQKICHQMSGTCLIELQQWMNFFSNNNWAFGCSVVQYILNCRHLPSAKSNVYGNKHDKKLNIPYEPQVNMGLEEDNVLLQEKQHSQHIETILNATSNLDVAGSENKEEDIEDRLDCTIITTNRLEFIPGFCSVCHKKGLSTLVKCSVCKKFVHLICAERLPVLTDYKGDKSKIVCSKC